VFIRTQTNGDRTYLMLVENERVGGRLVQRVLHRFGRLDELQAWGQIDGVLRSLGRFADKLVVLDAHADRDAIVTAPRVALPHGDRSLVGNKGYRRFLKTHGAHFAIDEGKVEEDARYDGLWVLRTDTDFDPTSGRQTMVARVG
jgi:hypothetical protein